MNAQGAEAAVASAEPESEVVTTTEAAGTAATAESELFGTRLGDLLGGMDLPEGVAEAVEKAQKPSSSATAAATTAATATTAEPAETTTEPKDGEHPVPDEWPVSAKQRVAQESEKRRSWKTKAEQAETKAKNLETKIAELSRRAPVQVTPTTRDPLSHIQDERELVRVATDAKQLRDFAVRYAHEGVQDLLVGKDPKSGEEIRISYTPEQLAEMQLEQEQILAAAQPRLNYIQMHRAIDRAVRTDYPKVFEEGTPENQEYNQILQQLPEITRFPDYPYWIADGIYRRNERLAAGKKKAGEVIASPTVRVLTTKQPPKAPTTTTARPPVVTERAGATRGNDSVSKLEKEAAESGGDDAALEKLLDGILDTGAGQRGPAAALV